MTGYQFFLSDDALPTFRDGPIRNEDIIGDSALRHILQDKSLQWDELPVRDVLQKAIANSEWKVSAARNPEIFLKNFDYSLDRPDVLIFDWDYPGLIRPSEDFLMEFLQTTYCLVRVYTGVEKVQEVVDILNKPSFAPFKARLSVSEKSKVDADLLLKYVQEQRESNFSYKFGAQLHRTTLDSVEEILVSLGRISINEVMSLLNSAAAGEGDLKEMFIEKVRNHLREDHSLNAFLIERSVAPSDAQALIDLIAEKLRNDLNASEIQLIKSNPGGLSAADPKVAEAAASLWSYRLYYNPSDAVVRRGDIVKSKTDGSTFVVVSADCDLNRLWQKNYGRVNLVPAFLLRKDCPILTERFRLAKIKNTAVFKASSLTSTVQGFPEGTLLLPFVPMGADRFNFLVSPKEITSIAIPDPPNAENVDQVRNTCLSYPFFNDFERICSISEPFLTPFIYSLLESLSGVGVPDFPTPVKDTIHEISKKALFAQ